MSSPSASSSASSPRTVDERRPARSVDERFRARPAGRSRRTPRPPVAGSRVCGRTGLAPWSANSSRRTATPRAAGGRRRRRSGGEDEPRDRTRADEQGAGQSRTRPLAPRGRARYSTSSRGPTGSSACSRPASGSGSSSRRPEHQALACLRRPVEQLDLAGRWLPGEVAREPSRRCSAAAHHRASTLPRPRHRGSRARASSLGCGARRSARPRRPSDRSSPSRTSGSRRQ